MKLLLDENLPKRLKLDFPEHEIYTVRDKGWTSKVNGELLKVMLVEGFDALITFDRNLKHQQNFTRYPVTVFVLTAPSNRYLYTGKLVPRIKELLDSPLKVGPIEIRL